MGNYINFFIDLMIYFYHEKSRDMKYFLTLENSSFVTSYRETDLMRMGEILPPSTLNMKIRKKHTFLKEKN